MSYLVFFIVPHCYLDAKVLHVHPTSVLFTRKPRSGWVIFHEMEETKKTQYVAVLTCLDFMK